MKQSKTTLRTVKDAIHKWGFERAIAKKVHDIFAFWKAGNLDKSPFPGKKLSALVLAPHPDDESIGCGASVKLITTHGGTVDVLYFTDGQYGRVDEGPYGSESAEQFISRRKQEARAACQILGVRHHHFLGYRDTELRLLNELPAEAVRMINSDEYDLIFCPWPYDNHTDHVSTFRLFRNSLAEAIRPGGKNREVWLYEVWTPLHANRLVAVDETFDCKIAAIRAHVTQFAGKDYLYTAQALAQYRTLHLPVGVNYAEAFLVIDLKKIQSLP